MSATGRSDVRVPSDVYPTPAWVVHRLLEAAPLPGKRWLEPCAGDGAIIKAVSDFDAKSGNPIDGLDWTSVELRGMRESGMPVGLSNHCVRDFLGYAAEAAALKVKFDVILTNPPYSLAEEFIKASIPLADTVAMLLRLNFLGSESRATFLREYAPDVYVLPNRPSFVNGKTDSCEYAWMMWHGRKTTGTMQILASTPKSERCK